MFNSISVKGFPQTIVGGGYNMFENAFNTVRRDCIFESVAAHVTGLLPQHHPELPLSVAGEQKGAPSAQWPIGVD